MHIVDILALLSIALLSAKFAGGFLARFGVPSVLTELCTGILIGNLALASDFRVLESSELVRGLSELGVLFLLFTVGLETNLKEIGRVGKDASLAALFGVVAPFALAFAVVPLITHNNSLHTLFMAAALTATSVGITARVLRESGKLQSVSGKIILGAAVIDDILGIIILTIISAIATEGQVSPVSLLILLAKISAFGVGIFLLRRFVLPRGITKLRSLETSGSLTVLLLSLCLISAWLAEKSGLAAIIGAFALGIALDDVHFKGFRASQNAKLESLIQPVTDFLAPVFFIVMGMSVKLGALANPDSISLALVLIAVGIFGKLACGLAVSANSRANGGDRLLVGFGMIPRGEVGLIFAAMGLSLKVLNEADYAAVVMMVAVTTLLAPALIAWRARKVN